MAYKAKFKNGRQTTAWFAGKELDMIHKEADMEGISVSALIRNAVLANLVDSRAYWSDVAERIEYDCQEL